MPDPRHDELMKYFMQKTDERLTAIDEKLSSLGEFKIKMMVSSRWVSLIISVICGLISLAVSTGVAIYIAKLEARETPKTTIESSSYHPRNSL